MLLPVAVAYIVVVDVRKCKVHAHVRGRNNTPQLHEHQNTVFQVPITTDNRLQIGNLKINDEIAVAGPHSQAWQVQGKVKKTSKLEAALSKT